MKAIQDLVLMRKLQKVFDGYGDRTARIRKTFELKLVKGLALVKKDT